MSDGDLVIDNFKLTNNCIATGTYSQIWEVVDQESNEHFAMKLLLPEAREDPDQLKSFRHEVRMAKMFDHPNFVKVHATTISKKRAYLVMDLFRAPNVKVLIQSDVCVIQQRIGKLVESVCMALGFMHEKGWVHRDIKPDNILFSKGSEMRLIDFSLATRSVSGLGKVFAGRIQFIQGTRTYIAPETVRKQHAVPQTDMYSLGVSLFEILTGEPPFRGSSPDDLLRKHLREKPPEPSALNPNVTKDADRIVVRLLAKKPEQRYQSMQELFAEFRSIKVFQEDPAEYFARTQKADEEVFEDSLANRLNSRADAERGGRSAPDQPQPPAANKSPAAAAPKPSAPPPQPAPPPPQQAPAPPQPMMPPQPVAQYPPMPQPPIPYPMQMPAPPMYQPPTQGGMPPGGPPYQQPMPAPPSQPPAAQQPQPPAPQPPAPRPQSQPQQPAAQPPAPRPQPQPAAQQEPTQPAKQQPAPPKPKPKPKPEEKPEESFDIDSFKIS